jgi:hypothetical protein
MTISVCGSRDFTKAIPEGDLRSTAMEALWRVRRSPVGGGSLVVSFEWVRFGIARSSLRTEAPLSASRRPANGPVKAC